MFHHTRQVYLLFYPVSFSLLVQGYSIYGDLRKTLKKLHALWYYSPCCTYNHLFILPRLKSAQDGPRLILDLCTFQNGGISGEVFPHGVHIQSSSHLISLTFFLMASIAFISDSSQVSFPSFWSFSGMPRILTLLHREEFSRYSCLSMTSSISFSLLVNESSKLCNLSLVL